MTRAMYWPCGSLDITGQNQRVGYYPSGRPDNGSSVTLQADNITVTVYVEPVTGFVSVSD